jgi:hypothetical protein
MKVFLVDHFGVSNERDPVHIYIVAESEPVAWTLLVEKYGPCSSDNVNFCELDTTQETIGEI